MYRMHFNIAGDFFYGVFVSFINHMGLIEKVYLKNEVFFYLETYLKKKTLHLGPLNIHLRKIVLLMDEPELF